MSAFHPPQQTYRDPASFARAVTIALVLVAGVQAMAVAFVVTRLTAGTTLTFSISDQGTVDGPDGFDIFQWVSLMVSVMTYGAWLAWQYRVHSNARLAARERVPTSAGWGVLCWFIPFVNLVKPYLVMREIRRASVSDPFRRRWIVGLWWACWIAPMIVGVLAVIDVVSDLVGTLSRSSGPPRLIMELDEGPLRLIAAGQLSMILAASLAILLVREISHGQISRAATGGPTGSVPARPDVG